jgi:carboxypeptidase PM20D1
MVKTLFIRGIVTLIVAAGVLTAVLFSRMALLQAPPRPGGEAHPFVFDEEGAAERLAGALRIPTVSAENPAGRDLEEFARFHRYLEETYPALHDALEVETVSGYSLLYTWEGTASDLPPVLLSAHMDVVPVDEASLAEWTRPPFDGGVADGYVWGRGALDMKGPLVAILEAVEGLVAEGVRPRRTVLLAFGHDEETGGREGARRIAALLAERGVRPEWVLDEGSAVATGVLRGMADPLGLVGTAEKGYLTVELRARDAGGHSAVPPDSTVAGKVSRAVTRLEEAPFPARIEGPAREFLLTVAPHMDPGTRMLAANLWLLERPVARAFAGDPLTASLVRTTTAPTVLQAGMRENVLPTEATALVNFRIAPWDTVESVLERVREVLADLDVEVRIRDEDVGAFPPSPVSSTESEGFRLIRESIHRVFPDVLAVAPFLVFVATDARHYEEVAGDVYRFAPFRADPSTLERVHGIDERISVRSHLEMIRFYGELIRRAGEGE